MNNITQEQIERLERVGIAISDSILKEYGELKKSDDAKDKKIKDAFMQLDKIVDSLKGDEE